MAQPLHDNVGGIVHTETATRTLPGSTITMPDQPIFCRGVREIVDRIDCVILDLWGCMHDGVTCYPAAMDCLRHLRGAGKRVAIVSNAPRRIAEVAKRIAEMGITPDLYDGLYSSGEETWRQLHDRAIPEIRHIGRVAYPIMSAKDQGLLAGLNLDITDDISRAGFLLAIGVEGPQDRVEQFDDLLRRAAWDGLPLLCANPDLMVHRGGVAEICAGAIAHRYEELGGTVIYNGKPYPGIYRRCLAEMQVDDPSRVMGVGDSCRTDIAGAMGIGAKSLFLGGGIHRDDVLRDGGIDPHLTIEMMRKYQVMATYAMAALAW